MYNLFGLHLDQLTVEEIDEIFAQCKILWEQSGHTVKLTWDPGITPSLPVTPFLVVVMEGAAVKEEVTPQEAISLLPFAFGEKFKGEAESILLGRWRSDPVSFWFDFLSNPRYGEDRFERLTAVAGSAGLVVEERRQVSPPHLKGTFLVHEETLCSFVEGWGRASLQGVWSIYFNSLLSHKRANDLLTAYFGGGEGAPEEPEEVLPLEDPDYLKTLDPIDLRHVCNALRYSNQGRYSVHYDGSTWNFVVEETRELPPSLLIQAKEGDQFLHAVIQYVSEKDPEGYLRWNRAVQRSRKEADKLHVTKG